MRGALDWGFPEAWMIDWSGQPLRGLSRTDMVEKKGVLLWACFS